MPWRGIHISFIDDGTQLSVDAVDNCFRHSQLAQRHGQRQLLGGNVVDRRFAVLSGRDVPRWDRGQIRVLSEGVDIGDTHDRVEIRQQVPGPLDGISKAVVLVDHHDRVEPGFGKRGRRVIEAWDVDPLQRA